MAAEDEKKEKEKEEKVEEAAIITAVYKVNLHCEQCARDIKKPLLRTQGIPNDQCIHLSYNVFSLDFNFCDKKSCTACSWL